MIEVFAPEWDLLILDEPAFEKEPAAGLMPEETPEENALLMLETASRPKPRCGV
jgi:hypothetical protein